MVVKLSDSPIPLIIQADKCNPIDITDSNVVFELPELPSSLDLILQMLGPIRTERPRTFVDDRTSLCLPKRIVEAADFSGLDFSTLTKIQIVDFGQTFFQDQPPPSLGTPIDYFPPEICFGYSPSSSSDIWSLACVLYKVECGSFLFPTFFEIFEFLVGTAVCYLGPLPEEWKGRFLFEEYGYREEGKPMNRSEVTWWFSDKFPDKSIDDRLTKEAPHLSNRQREDFVRLLRDMVVYEPEKRLSATDVVERLGESVFPDELAQPGG